MKSGEQLALNDLKKHPDYMLMKNTKLVIAFTFNFCFPWSTRFVYNLIRHKG